MIRMRSLLVLALLSAASMTAFGWGNATHVYIAHRLGSQNPRTDARELYGSVLNDAYNLDMSPVGQYMYDQLHHNPMPFFRCAYRCELKAVAFGFASHNGLWGADFTAHEHMIPGKKDTGYAVFMGQQLTETIAPALLVILGKQGISPADPTSPDDPVVQFAYGIAPELGHDLSETAVDILLKRKLDREGLPIGFMMMEAARTRPVDVPIALTAAYSVQASRATHTPYLQVVKTIVAGEKANKETIMQYGGLFTQDETTVVIPQLAAASAGVAGQYLTYYFNYYNPGAGVTITVSPDDVAPLIAEAMAMVNDSWEPELEKTIRFAQKELDSHNVKSCSSAFALGKEDAGAPAVAAPGCFSLDGNYPNPFNPSTTIAFRLPADAPVSLEIYNVLGQKVRTLLDQAPYSSGAWKVVWDGRSDAGSAVPSGTYFCRLSSLAGTMTTKMTMTK